MMSTMRGENLLTPAKVAALAIVTAVMTLAISVPAAFAATIPELSSDAEAYPRPGVPVPVRVTLDQIAARDEALAIIQQYRLEAYEEGFVYLPDGMTKEQYVYGIVWDEDLERVAVQRAIESSVANEMNHTRPTGQRSSTAQSNGVGGSSENLAGMGTGRKHNANLGLQEFLRSYYGVERGLDIWHSEITSYRRNVQDGTNYSCGHYITLIDPKYTRYGVACVGVEWSTWIEWALEAGTGTAGENDGSVGYKGEYDAVVYANDNQCFDVSLYAYCVDGVVSPGGKSQIRLRGASGFTENASWDIEPTYARYESSDPQVVSVADNGQVTGISPGVATVTVTMGNESVNVVIPVTNDVVPIFRLYNPYSGEHFYTYDPAENESLASVGWRPEGLGWTAPRSSNTPVFRLYNPYAGEHHYTTDASERDALVRVGWNYEGVGWYSDDAKGTPLLREYNPNQFACNHNYTTDVDEHKWLVSIGWKDEGEAWYAVAADK